MQAVGGAEYCGCETMGHYYRFLSMLLRGTSCGTIYQMVMCKGDPKMKKNLVLWFCTLFIVAKSSEIEKLEAIENPGRLPRVG